MTPKEILIGICTVSAIIIWVLKEFHPQQTRSFLFGENVLENKKKENARLGLSPDTDEEKQMHRIIDEEAARRKASNNESAD